MYAEIARKESLEEDIKSRVLWYSGHNEDILSASSKQQAKIPHTPMSRTPPTPPPPRIPAPNGAPEEPTQSPFLFANNTQKT